MQKSNLVSDLENQLSAVKAENCALQMENMSLRNEIKALKESLSKFMVEHGTKISTVTMFGVICLYPVFSSCGLYSHEDMWQLVSHLTVTLPSAAVNHINGRILLTLLSSDEQASSAAATASAGGLMQMPAGSVCMVLFQLGYMIALCYALIRVCNRLLMGSKAFWAGVGKDGGEWTRLVTHWTNPTYLPK